jgi:hypothetical protein
MSSGASVRVQHEGALAVVTFDAPPLNLFDRANLRSRSRLARRSLTPPPSA